MMALWRGMVGRRRKLAVLCAAMMLGALMMVWVSSKKTPGLESHSQISKSNEQKVMKIMGALPQVSKDYSNWLVGGEVPGIENQTLSKQVLKDSELLNGDVKEVKEDAIKDSKTQEVEDYELGEEMEEIDGKKPENKLESYDYNEGIAHPTGDAALELPPDDGKMFDNNAKEKVKLIRQEPVDTLPGINHKSKVELENVDILPVKLDYTDVKQSKIDYRHKDGNNILQDLGYSPKQQKGAISPATLVEQRQSKMTGVVDESKIDMKASFGKLKQSKQIGMKNDLARKTLKSVYGGAAAVARFGQEKENDNGKERLRESQNPGDIRQGNPYTGDHKFNGKKKKVPTATLR